MTFRIKFVVVAASIFFGETSAVTSNAAEILVERESGTEMIAAALGNGVSPSDKTFHLSKSSSAKLVESPEANKDAVSVESADVPNHSLESVQTDLRRNLFADSTSGALADSTANKDAHSLESEIFSDVMIPRAKPFDLDFFQRELSAPYECARKFLTASKSNVAKAMKCIDRQAPQGVEERYLRAVALYRSGKLEEAAPLLEALAHDHPALADQCFWMAGKAYAAKAMEKSALKNFLAVDQDSSLADDARLLAAATMRRLGRLDDALAYLESLATRENKTPRHDMPAEALFARGEILQVQGKKKAAAGTFMEIWTRHPRSPLASVALTRAEKLKVFPTPLDKVIRGEHLVDAYKNAAALELVQPILAGASKAVDGEVMCRARVVVGRALRKTRRFKEAVEVLRPVFEKCATGSASWAAGLYTLGSAATSQNSSLAIDAFLKLEASMPESELSDDALFLAAGILEQRGDFEGARRLLRRLALLHPDGDHRPEALFRLAWISRKTGALGDAKDAFEQLEREYAVTDSEASVRAMYWRARVLGELGRTQESIDLYRSLAVTHSAGFYALLARTQLSRLESENFGVSSPEIPPSNVTDVKQLPENSGKIGNTDVASIAAVHGHGALSPSIKVTPFIDGTALRVNCSGRERENFLASEAGNFVLKTRVLTRDIRFVGAVELLAMGFSREGVQELLKIDRTRLRHPLPPDDLTTLAALLAMNGHARRAHVISRVELKQLFSASPKPADMTAWKTAWPRLFRDMIEVRAAEAGIDPDLLQGLVREESAFEPTAGSWAGAMGLCQLMMPTAREVASWLAVPGKITRERLHDPDLNLRMGATYLARLIRQFKGNTALAVAAYNAGAGSVRKFLARYSGDDMDGFIEEIPFEETRFYVKRVLGSMATYQMIYGINDAPILSEGLTIQR